jgi:hypothetical protein
MKAGSSHLYTSTTKPFWVHSLGHAIVRSYLISNLGMTQLIERPHLATFLSMHVLFMKLFFCLSVLLRHVAGLGGSSQSGRERTRADSGASVPPIRRLWILILYVH